MKELDKVILGLENCIKDADTDGCPGCPYGPNDDFSCCVALLTDALEALRSMEPVVHAHWGFYEDEQGDWWDRCSGCGGKIPNEGGYRSDLPRCPHCGAHMDEEVSE